MITVRCHQCPELEMQLQFTNHKQSSHHEIKKSSASTYAKVGTESHRTTVASFKTYTILAGKSYHNRY